MTCEIFANHDGEPCQANMMSRIRAHIAALEHFYGPLGLCRVMIETRNAYGPAKRSGVLTFIEMRPASKLEFLPSAYAVQDTAEAALDAAFGTALAIAERDHKVEHSLHFATAAGHIVEMSPTGRAGVLEMEDGQTLSFSVEQHQLEQARALHVGDRAWVAPHLNEDAPQILVCARRGTTVVVKLAAVSL